MPESNFQTHSRVCKEQSLTRSNTARRKVGWKNSKR
ncbi:hypothetical protein [Enterocloster citroniae]